MRRNSSADNANGNVQRFSLGKKENPFTTSAATGFAMMIWTRNEMATDTTQRDNKCFHLPDTFLQVKQQESIQHSERNAPYQRQPGEQLQTNGHAQYFGQIGGRYGDFCQQP